MSVSPLARLLAPLSVSEFVDEVLGQRDHHIARAERSDHFAPLPHGPSAVDDLLEQLRFEPDAVHAVRGAEHRPCGTYRLSDGTLDTAAVHRDLSDGYTIILERLDRHVRALGDLSHALEIELNYATQVNAYLSPPDSTGFLPHYDHHDVLVLQLHGSKTWHLYGAAAVTPQDMERRREVADIFGVDLPAPTDLLLRAGDTLYLPRGRVHGAETGREPSVHLTVGIHVPTALILLTHMLQVLSFTDDRIHARLPARHLDDAEVRAGLAGIVGDALGLLSDSGVLAGGLDAFEELLVRRGRLPPVGQLADAAEIDAGTRVRKHQPLYARVISAEGRIGLQFAQLVLGAGADHEAALRFVARRTEPFRVGELPGLTTAQQVELARSLITSGFLVRNDQSTGS